MDLRALQPAILSEFLAYDDIGEAALLRPADPSGRPPRSAARCMPCHPPPSAFACLSLPLSASLRLSPHPLSCRRLPCRQPAAREPSLRLPTSRPTSRMRSAAALHLQNLSASKRTLRRENAFWFCLQRRPCAPAARSREQARSRSCSAQSPSQSPCSRRPKQRRRASACSSWTLRTTRCAGGRGCRRCRRAARQRPPRDGSGRLPEAGGPFRGQPNRRRRRSRCLSTGLWNGTARPPAARRSRRAHAGRAVRCGPARALAGDRTAAAHLYWLRTCIGCDPFQRRPPSGGALCGDSASAPPVRLLKGHAPRLSLSLLLFARKRGCGLTNQVAQLPRRTVASRERMRTPLVSRLRPASPHRALAGCAAFRLTRGTRALEYTNAIYC